MTKTSVRDHLGTRPGTTDSLKRVLRNSRIPSGNEEGFVLVASLLILVVLTLLGAFATSTSTIEALIAGNDSVAKQTFYTADAGTQTGVEMIEQNVSCPTGFDPIRTTIGGVDLYDATFALDETMSQIPGADGGTVLADLPSDLVRTLRIATDPVNRVDTEPHTNLALWGTTKYLPGSGTEMVAGYDKVGGGSAKGGAMIEYDLHSQHIGIRNSEAIVAIKWRHIIGQQGTCAY